MGVIYTPGQLLARGDLDIFLQNPQGNPSNVFEITYAIFYVDPNSGDELLIGDPARVPVNPAVGEYYASLLVPTGVTLGEYRIRWDFREFAGGAVQQVVQEFGIVDPNNLVIVAGSMTATEQALVNTLRVMIRDQNPDKFYRFRPPEHEGRIGTYNRIFGQIWEDAELVEYLRLSLDWFNMAPPNTGGKVHSLDVMMNDRFSSSWRTAILWGAIVHAMFALATNWTADEFSYSIGGISLDIEKSSKYESLKQNAEGQVDKALEYKQRTVKYIKGLQQSKYGQGVRSSFGPSSGRGVLSVRNFI